MNRYYSYEVYCQCGGSPVRRMKHADPEKHRDTRSRRTGCPAAISTRWSQDDEKRGLGPRISKIDLRHNHQPPIPAENEVVDAGEVDREKTKIEQLANVDPKTTRLNSSLERSDAVRIAFDEDKATRAQVNAFSREKDLQRMRSANYDDWVAFGKKGQESVGLPSREEIDE